MRVRLRPNRLMLFLTLLACLLLPSLAGARPEAESVVLFIGDGMGAGQVEMTGLANGRPLTIQKMPYSGTVTTTSLGGGITDSAAAATALATGHKTENGMLGMLPGGVRIQNITELFRKNGKSIGIMTQDALWGATPAGFVVHVNSRGQYADIATQMAKSGALVMMGTGREEFLPTSAGGKRTDNLDLLAGLRKSGYEIVTTKDELAKAKGLQLVGLFADGPTSPRLADIVKAALPRLAQNPKGFFLMVEHPRIDYEPGDSSVIASYVNELDEAVQAALDFAGKRGETLVLVTGDHETGGLVIDDPRKAPALQKVKGSASAIARRLNADRSNAAQVMADSAGIKDLAAQETDQIKKAKDPGAAIAVIVSTRAGVRWTSNGGHTATPVRVFASGPGAERFTGYLDNTQIPNKIADALGLGPFPR